MYFWRARVEVKATEDAGEGGEQRARCCPVVIGGAGCGAFMEAGNVAYGDEPSTSPEKLQGPMHGCHAGAGVALQSDEGRLGHTESLSKSRGGWVQESLMAEMLGTEFPEVLGVELDDQIRQINLDMGAIEFVIMLREWGLSWPVVARFFGRGDWSRDRGPVSGAMVRMAYNQSVQARALKSERDAQELALKLKSERDALRTAAKKMKPPKRKKKRTAVVLRLVPDNEDKN